MTERYIATSASGAHVVRTNSKAEADGYAVKLRGCVIDTESEAA